jgi:hypothetical protein
MHTFSYISTEFCACFLIYFSRPTVPAFGIIQFQAATYLGNCRVYRELGKSRIRTRDCCMAVRRATIEQLRLLNEDDTVCMLFTTPCNYEWKIFNRIQFGRGTKVACYFKYNFCASTKIINYRISWRPANRVVYLDVEDETSKKA